MHSSLDTHAIRARSFGSLCCQALPKTAATVGANYFIAAGPAVALDADLGAYAGFMPALSISQQQVL